MVNPYREVELAPPPKPKSGTFVYRPKERGDRIANGRATIGLFALPSVAAIILGNVFTLEIGALAFGVSLAASFWWSRRYPKDVVLFRVEDGELRISPMGSPREVLRVDLDGLDDVQMETKRVQRVLDSGTGAVNIGLGPLAPAVGAVSEAKRIVLTLEGGRSHTLTSDFFGDVDTSEWFAKMRVFLRSVGWVPLSERGESESEAEGEADDVEPLSAAQLRA